MIILEIPSNFLSRKTPVELDSLQVKSVWMSELDPSKQEISRTWSLDNFWRLVKNIGNRILNLFDKMPDDAGPGIRAMD